MSQAFANRLLKASAGTGKTFQLSAHFVGLLLDGVAPERILASTFTRKAAGEILERVWQRLVNAATDPKEAKSLSKVLERDVRCEQVQTLLPGLARQIDRFQVRTLDSMAIWMVRLFEAELGLAPGWSIVDDTQDADLRDEALISALSDGDEERWMSLLRGLDPSGDRRGVHEHLMQAVRDLRLVYIDSEPGSWERLPVPEPLSEDALEHLETRLREFRDLPTTAKGDVTKNWANAWKKVREAVANRAWGALLEVTLVSKVVEGEDKFDRREIPEAVQAMIRELVGHAQAELLLQLSERNRATYSLLEAFEQSYSSWKQRLGWLRFEDIPRLLDPAAATGPWAGEGSLDELWMRMDARIDHLMLDEFQDTSAVQWRSLEPLVQEIVATHGGEQGRTFFCVGDAKQSIYGWRQAEPRLLEQLPDMLPGLQAKEMGLNYRSSGAIMDFTNRVFQNLPGLPMFVGEDVKAECEAAEAFTEAFPKHTAHAADAPAEIRLWRVQPDGRADSRETRERRLQWAAQRVADMRARFPGGTIGVLFRTRSSIARFLHLLGSKHGLRASEEGGNPLVDSDWVAVIASLLDLVDHPGDTAAAFHVLTSPIAPLLGLDPRRWAGAQRRKALGRNEEFLAVLQELSGQLRALWQHEGFANWLQQVEPLVQAQGTRWDRERFAQLLDQAHRFSGEGDLRPAQWARQIREQKVPSPFSASIRVMSIHASKGLEFDVVVLPDLDDPWFKNGGPRVVAGRPDTTSPFDRVSLVPSKGIYQGNAFLDGLITDQRRRETQEHLNLLYVSITRARSALEIVSCPYRTLSSGHLICELLGGEQEPQAVEGVEDVHLIWSHLKGDWPAPAKESKVGETPELTREGHEPIAFRGTWRRSQALAPSHAGRSAAVMSTAQCLDGGMAVTRGDALHRMLEAVTWLEREPQPGEVDRGTLADSSIPAGQGQAWADELEAALADPAVRSAFVRREGWRVYNERAFLWHEDGRLWNGATDRLLVEMDGDEVVGAELYDFKTGGLHQEPAELIAAYRPQIEVYRRAVARAFGLRAEEVVCRLLMLDRKELLTVPFGKGPG
ncbi:MAG: UvrD-helicase domain-containing protein [Planctomycetota bacterium]